MILIQQSYCAADPRRQREIAAARTRNVDAGVFTAIEAIDGGSRRATFADLLDMAATRFPGRVCVIANSDIAFDASLLLAEPLVLGDRPAVVALTRWDDAAGPSMEGRVDAATWRFYSHSQDAWVFVGGRLPPFQADFLLGIPACESRFAFAAAAAGVAVLDPALSIRPWHLHASGVRTWSRRQAYQGPLLFPRLTTTDDTAGGALVVERHGWGTREIPIPCTGDAAAFATALVTASRRAGPLGLRSPIYRRRRS